MSMLRKPPGGCGHAEMFNTDAIFYGIVTIVGDLDISGNVQIGGTLGVTGATTLSSTLDVTDTITGNSNLEIDGAGFIGASLVVTEQGTFQDTLLVNGAATLQNTLDVTGAATLASTLDVTGETTITAGLGVGTNATVGGTLGVVGKTSCFGELQVTQKTTLDAALDVLGSAEFKNTSGVSLTSLGITALEGAVNISGVVTGTDLWNLRGLVTIGLPPPAPATGMTHYGTYTLNGSFSQGPSVAAISHFVDVTGAVSITGGTNVTIDGDASNLITSQGEAKINGLTTVVGSNTSTSTSVSGDATSVFGTVSTNITSDGLMNVKSVDGIMTIEGLETNIVGITALTIDCADIDLIGPSIFLATDGIIGYEFTPAGCVTPLPWLGPILLEPASTLPSGGPVAEGWVYYDDGTNSDTGQGALRVRDSVGFKDLMVFGTPFVDLTTQSTTPTGQDGRLYIDDGTNTASGDPAVRFHDGTSFQDLSVQNVITTFNLASIDPRIGGTAISGVSGDGYYTVLGRMVTFWFSFLWSSDTSALTGNITMNLPFQSSDSQTIPGNFIYNRIQLSAGYDHLGYTNVSGTLANFFQYGSTSDRLTLRGTNTAAGTGQKYIFGYLSYLKAA